MEKPDLLDVLQGVRDQLKALGSQMENDPERPTKRQVRLWVENLETISDEAQKALDAYDDREFVVLHDPSNEIVGTYPSAEEAENALFESSLYETVVNRHKSTGKGAHDAYNAATSEFIIFQEDSSLAWTP